MAPTSFDQRPVMAARRVMVTGGAQGIGFGVAEALIGAGASVALLDIDEDAAREAAQKIGAVAVQCNVGDEESVRRAVAETAQKLGGLDGAVNNAGIVTNTPAEEMSGEEFQRVVAINLTGTFFTAREAGKLMLAQGYGSMVNTASGAAHIVVHPQPQVSYNASKTAVLGLTRSLAAEWATRGVRVNSVSPGYTRTPLVDSPALADKHKEWAALTPMGRLAEVDDLIGAYVFLLSDAARFITGQDLVVDGGYTLW